jgi:hypothetical protein
MAGGAWEYVMGNRTTSTTGITNCSSCSSYMATSPNLNYLNLYGARITLPNILGTGSLEHSFGIKPSWSSGSSETHYNWDVCIWEICGGQALSEIIAVQSVSNRAQAWSSDYSDFIMYSSGPWFERGGDSSNTSFLGVFATHAYDGNSYTDRSFRASLVGF